ncbi:MAG TPA: phosphatidylserine decarboxylase family protein [Bacteroidota bacterium]|nr:phosphatidylserine decarboxylase family protein [Bacteroidota bacterium]
MPTRYGLDVLLAAVLIAIAVSTAAFVFLPWEPLRAAIVLFCVVVLAFTFWFFRDPERETPEGENLVVSPADGEVVLVRPVQDDEFLKGEGIQVSIFMSPLNVHVNRFPISGTVTFFKHIPGEYVVAFEEKASTRNERTLIGVENTRAKVLFKQIAGFVARRIVANVRVGDAAVAGRRFGMIKFGSRVDVLVPPGAAIKVKVGEKTIAGETVLAVVS